MNTRGDNRDQQNESCTPMAPGHQTKRAAFFAVFGQFFPLPIGKRMRVVESAFLVFLFYESGVKGRKRG